MNSPEYDPGQRQAEDGEEEVERAWEPDEAQDELIGAPAVNDAEDGDPIATAETLITRLQDLTSRLPQDSEPLSSSERLPFPVIIPQRRSKERSRGFVRAYSPISEDRGIDQTMFIHFIETFNNSTQSSKWIQALNLASIGTTWLPTLISILVSMAINMVTTAVAEVQGRHKTNYFLEKVNKDFFMPRGLFCLVLTWNPDQPGSQSAVDFQSLSTKTMNKERFMAPLRSSNGKTYREFEWSDSAPLIYPAVDALASTSGDKAASTKSSLKKKRKFVDDYLDRRGQAKFAMNNPDSALAKGPKPKFTSRFADPSHPANSGSLIALITRGAIPLPTLNNLSGGVGNARSNRGGLLAPHFNRGIGGRSAGNTFGREIRRASDQGFANGNGMLGPQTLRERAGPNSSPAGLVQKVMEKDVLYLLVVGMPTEEELAQARETVSQMYA